MLTVVLDSFGEASLKTLVHGLQSSRDVSVPELDRLGAHQLLQRRQHRDASLYELARAEESSADGGAGGVSNEQFNGLC